MKKLFTLTALAAALLFSGCGDSENFEVASPGTGGAVVPNPVEPLLPPELAPAGPAVQATYNLTLTNSQGGNRPGSLISNSRSQVTAVFTPAAPPTRTFSAFIDTTEGTLRRVVRINLSSPNELRQGMRIPMGSTTLYYAEIPPGSPSGSQIFSAAQGNVVIEEITGSTISLRLENVQMRQTNGGARFDLGGTARFSSVPRS